MNKIIALTSQGPPILFLHSLDQLLRNLNAAEQVREQEVMLHVAGSRQPQDNAGGGLLYNNYIATIVLLVYKICELSRSLLFFQLYTLSVEYSSMYVLYPFHNHDCY